MPDSLNNRLTERARELGFIAIGFSPPETPPHFDHFTSWISAQKNAGMSWMERNIEIRKNPSLLLPGCRTIISLAYPYSARKPGTPDGLSVSRYSQPDREDYHYRLKGLCRDLAGMIGDRGKGMKSRICVDSAPVLERSFAHLSGMGFIGKNNMLIMPGVGSFFYLAEILTTASLDIPSIEPMANLCDSCNACVESCPTGALEKPFCLDASRCLSYLTVEHKGIPHKANGRKMGDCFFGCDRCQEVCPFNGKERERNICLPSAQEFLHMEEEVFLERFGRTSFARAGFKKIKANIRLLIY